MDATEFPNAALVSPRWVEWRRAIDIADYDARFERLAAAGNDVHGEADFITAMDPGTVLDAGCGTGRIAIELARRGIDVTGVDLDADMVAAAMAKAPGQSWRADDLARMQLPHRFQTVAMPGNVMLFCEPADRRLIVHNLAQHLLPGGRLVEGSLSNATDTPSPNGTTTAPRAVWRWSTGSRPGRVRRSYRAATTTCPFTD